MNFVTNMECMCQRYRNQALKIPMVLFFQLKLRPDTPTLFSWLMAPLSWSDFQVTPVSFWFAFWHCSGTVWTAVLRVNLRHVAQRANVGNLSTVLNSTIFPVVADISMVQQFQELHFAYQLTLWCGFCQILLVLQLFLFSRNLWVRKHPGDAEQKICHFRDKHHSWAMYSLGSCLPLLGQKQ